MRLAAAGALSDKRGPAQSFLGTRTKFHILINSCRRRPRTAPLRSDMGAKCLPWCLTQPCLQIKPLINESSIYKVSSTLANPSPGKRLHFRRRSGKRRAQTVWRQVAFPQCSEPIRPYFCGLISISSSGSRDSQWSSWHPIWLDYTEPLAKRGWLINI